MKEITPSDPSLKIPQIGWNTIHVKHPHPLFDGIPTGEDGLHAYFVHSYHLDSLHEDEVLAVTDYGGPGNRRRRARQSRRHAVPSRKEPGARPGPHRQFPEVEAMTQEGLLARDGRRARSRRPTRSTSRPTRRPSPNTARASRCAPAATKIPKGPTGNRHVVLEFDSYEIALACYASPEYQHALQFRLAASTGLRWRMPKVRLAASTGPFRHRRRRLT